MSTTSGTQGGTTNVIQTGDPSLAGLNSLTTGEIARSLPQVGGLPGILAFDPLSQPSAAEQQIYGAAANSALGPLVRPQEQQGLNILAGAGNPQMQLDAATQQFNQLVAPSLINRQTAQGQGRSGATTEALANAAAQMALPIIQSSMAAQQDYGNKLLSFGNLLEGREPQRYSQALTAAAAPRQAAYAEERRAPDTLLAMLQRFPIQSGAGGSTSNAYQNQTQGFNWGNLASALGSVALASGTKK